MRPVATGAEKLVPAMVRIVLSFQGKRARTPPGAANSTSDPARLWICPLETPAEESTATTLEKCAGQTRTDDPPLLQAATI